MTHAQQRDEILAAADRLLELAGFDPHDVARWMRAKAALLAIADER